MKNYLSNHSPIVTKKSQPEIGDLVFISADKYKIVGETKSKLSWKLSHIGPNPYAKNSESYNKKSFLKRFIHDSKCWTTSSRKNKYPFAD